MRRVVFEDELDARHGRGGSGDDGRRYDDRGDAGRDEELADGIDPGAEVDDGGEAGEPSPDPPEDPGAGGSGAGGSTELDDDGLPRTPRGGRGEGEASGGSRGSPGTSEEGDLLRMPPEELKKAIEAILFSVSEPLPIRVLADLFDRSVHDIREAVEELRYEYADTGRAFRLEDIAGGVQLLTLPAYDPWIRGLRQRQSRFRLSAAAFETLSVIAYKQPITKADLEAIRGVQCGQVLKNLLDRGLVRVVGRDESLGRPLLYGTTQRFLESFGISSVRELPQPDLEPRRKDRETAGKAEDEDDGGADEERG